MATAKRLQQEGTRVLLSGRSKKTLYDAVGTIGNGVLGIQAALRSSETRGKRYAEVSQSSASLVCERGHCKECVAATEDVFEDEFDMNITKSM